MLPALPPGARLALCALGFVVAFAFLEWARGRALSRPGGRRASDWFLFALRAQWTAVLAIALWPWAVWSAGELRLAADPMLDHSLRWALALLPIALLAAYAEWRSAEVARVLRGLEGTPRQSLERAARPLAAMTLIAGGLMLAQPVLRVAGGMASLIVLLLGLIGALLVLRRRQAGIEMTPHAVTAGELRDRLFALAARAGVRLQQLYVVPIGRMRLANAFAVQGNTVILTDHLLQGLARDEVDAVMGHELAHLRHGHPARMSATLIGALALAATAFALGAGGGAAIALGVLGMFLFLALCRRFEYAADAGAIALGAKPEALISGLARLGRLNDVPARWGRALEAGLTHPSLERRAVALGRRHGIAAAAVAALLEADAPPADLYAVPASLANGGKVFSTTFKRRLLVRHGLAVAAAAALAPALALAVLGLVTRGAPARLPALTLAISVAGLAAYGASMALARFPHRAVRRKLAAALAARGPATPPEDAVLVGLAPGGESRAIEGFWIWDVGLLDFGSERIEYAGEETRWSLVPGRIAALELVAGPPSWRRTRVVRIAWVDDAGVCRTLRLFALEPKRRGGHGAAAVELYERLDAWRWGPAHERWAIAPGAAPAPRHVEVTSVAPRELARPGAILAVAVLQLVFASLACALFGIARAPWQGPGIFEVWLAAFGAQVALVIPALRHREPAPVERASDSLRAAA